MEGYGVWRVGITSLACLFPLAIPSIWLKISVLSLREASCSPSPRTPTRASTSSKKITDGDSNLAASKRHRTIFSLSPRYFDTRDEEGQLKNVDLFCWFKEHTALASRVFPVPGGPNSSTPRHGSRIPVKNSGMSNGKTTASLSSRLAVSRAAISENVTDTSCCTTSLRTVSIIALSWERERD